MMIIYDMDTDFNVKIQNNLNLRIDKQNNMYYIIQYKKLCNIYIEVWIVA